MKNLLWMLCLLSSGAVAQEQTYDYQGQAMTEGNVTETYTAVFTFFGPLADLSTPLNFSFNVAGNAYKGGGGCEGCAIGFALSNTEPTTITVNSSHNVLTSAYLNSVSYDAPGLNTPYFNIGPHGDSLALVAKSTGATVFSISNDTPGIWTKAPELDASTAFGAITLLGCLMLMAKARPRSCRRVQ